MTTQGRVWRGVALAALLGNAGQVFWGHVHGEVDAAKREMATVEAKSLPLFLGGERPTGQHCTVSELRESFDLGFKAGRVVGGREGYMAGYAECKAEDPTRLRVVR